MCVQISQICMISFIRQPQKLSSSYLFIFFNIQKLQDTINNWQNLCAFCCSKFMGLSILWSTCAAGPRSSAAGWFLHLQNLAWASTLVQSPFWHHRKNLQGNENRPATESVQWIRDSVIINCGQQEHRQIHSAIYCLSGAHELRNSSFPFITNKPQTSRLWPLF